MVIYISTSVANELKPHQQLETVQQNETIINSESNFLNLIDFISPEKNISSQPLEHSYSGHNAEQETPLIPVSKDIKKKDLEVEEVSDIDEIANQIIFGSKPISQSITVQLSQQEKSKTKLEESSSETVEIPSGIENIGADMIKLVDQIIFGEKDPTQRLDLAPVLENISQAMKTPHN